MKVFVHTQNKAVRPPYSALFGAPFLRPLVRVSENPRRDNCSDARLSDTRRQHEIQRRQLLPKRLSLESLKTAD